MCQYLFISCLEHVVPVTTLLRHNHVGVRQGVFETIGTAL